MGILEKYILKETLGQGSYGKVKLGVHCETFVKVAVKILATHESGRLFMKEAQIMERLLHKNVIRLIEVEKSSIGSVLVVEFAEGGELFDRIEPDVGINESLAHFYFVQLVRAVEYIHSRGVCHRDIKPENILLDRNGHLKLSDFGLATLFITNGKPRALRTPCGTMPYVAPEVLNQRYSGPQADIWSCGIVLIVMLTGVIPWDEPTLKSAEFRNILNGNFDFFPFVHFSPHLKNFLQGILSVNPANRFGILEIKGHSWFLRANRFFSLAKSTSELNMLQQLEAVSMQSNLNLVSLNHIARSSSQVIGYQLRKNQLFISQPFSMTNPSISMNSQSPLKKNFELTQRLRSSDDISQYSQMASQAPHGLQIFEENIRRMTRLLTNTSPDLVMQKIKSFALQKKHIIQRNKTPYKIFIHVKCANGEGLIFKIRIFQSIHSSVGVIDFSRVKGHLLDFKRLFRLYSACIQDMLVSI
eukprot:TRINITY_DN44160_c0_g1_i2.p1 TRINITY_DN44160_c0_g1~~TRINITY_DN44160_c0_g1_i2.p1  ORF type:complete len:502 (+),score=-7.12 TRINITY_DN44160_c0_g1_i2:92-1507(+)